ncbi:GatB/YqeY domain-containing protein [Daejeonella sp.]|uniref:GatB/YqeY domain-containing protein n=1 Tax=Daejeonella sp. TaxID=2805397 RepID=UPI0025BDBE8D|nr:GatB/YqeY domain-containing protein [Daejeonella sp.]
MSLQQTIDQDIKAAMLNKDSAKLRGLRAIKAALLLAKTEKGAEEGVSEEMEIKVLQKLVKQRKESADIYQAQNRPDLFEIENEELQVIEAYLPKQMDRDAIIFYIKEVVTRTGATSMKDMGRVMGLVNKELAGKADGKTISEVVKELLGN